MAMEQNLLQLYHDKLQALLRSVSMAKQITQPPDWWHEFVGHLKQLGQLCMLQVLQEVIMAKRGDDPANKEQAEGFTTLTTWLCELSSWCIQSFTIIRQQKQMLSVVRYMDPAVSFIQQNQSKLACVVMWRATFEAAQKIPQLRASIERVKDAFQARTQHIKEWCQTGSYDEILKYFDDINAVEELRAVLPVEESDEMCRMKDKAQSLVKTHRATIRIAAEKSLQADDYITANNHYKALEKTESLERCLGDVGTTESIRGLIENLLSRQAEKAKASVGHGMTTDGLNKFAESLVQLQQMSEEIVYAESKAQSTTQSLLQDFQAKNNAAGLSILAARLNNLQGKNEHAQRWGRQIVQDNDQFAAIQNYDFNKRTGAYDVNYVLEKLTSSCDELSKTKDTLMRQYNQYLKRNNELVTQHLTPDINRNQLGRSSLVQQVIQDARMTSDWSAMVTTAPKLLAQIFAVWTVFTSTNDYFEHGCDAKYLRTPHAVQVMAILRLLNVDVQHRSLWGAGHTPRNHLAEVKTGEGKSVTLAALAVLLALSGYRVDVVCYSQHLSTRDYKEFESFFALFGLTQNNLIRYGTFETLAEIVINDMYGDIRGMVSSLVSNSPPVGSGRGDHGQSSCTKKKKKKKEILLIDEVDVFFKESFCNQMYRPRTTYRSPAVSQLLRHVWSQRAEGITADAIYEHGTYKAVSEELGDFHFLAATAVESMIYAMSTITPGSSAQRYKMVDGQISYKLHDGYSASMKYGYLTMCDYLQEYENGSITADCLDHELALEILGLEFSYAKLPGKYWHILGVTGTLKELSDEEKQIIVEQYKIERDSYMPSMYGDSNLMFEKTSNVQVYEDEDNHMLAIQKEILEVLKQSRSKRAILVFFEDEDKLNTFFYSSYGQSIIDTGFKLECTTEKDDPHDRKRKILQASGPGKVTLFTRSFGRGTDFCCRSDEVREANGIHVIQSFFSEDTSEERQIKGRTARQGEKGSYSMILCATQLEQMEIPKSESLVWERKDIYKELDHHRCNLTRVRNTAREKEMVKVEGRYQETLAFCKNLQNASQGSAEAMEQAILFLRKRNTVQSCTGQDGNSRTCVLLDATASMSHLLSSCKATLHEVFTRTSQILGEQNFDATFEMQIVVFRNYNAPPDMLLEHSIWERYPQHLEMFLEAVKPTYGWQNEAIEIAFNHVLTEHEKTPVSQVILIGDAPPNTNEEMVWKRAENARHYENSKFNEMEDCQKLLPILAEKKIPVNAFYVAHRAKEAFENFASTTNANAGYLDIYSQRGADELMNIVAKQILESIGGEKLVRAYEATFSS